MVSLGVAYKLSEKWSIGLANNFIYRSHTYNKTELARMILNNTANTLVDTGETQNIEYTNLRYTGKLGVAFKSGNFSAGITINSPSITLGGTGTIARDLTADNLQINTQTDPKKTANYARIFVAANDRQSGLKTTYKSPLSIAGGVVYDNKTTILAFSAEWFSSIGIYNIMSPANNLFKRPTNLSLDGTKFLEVNASNKSVFNWSIGYHRVLTKKISISTGFRTNKSFYDRTYDNRVIQTTRTTLSNNPLNLDISSWNIYHFVLGGTFSQERRDISLGLNVSFASEGSLKQFANFDKPTEASFLLGQQTTTSANFLSYGLLLGYTFRFKSANGRQ
jgi:hypothetical protein